MITLKQAQTIIGAALEHGRAHSLKPLAIIVLDAGGHPISSAREDNASFFRLEISKSKAVGALGMGDDSRILADRAAKNPAFFQGLSAVVAGNITYSPGGVLVHDADGQIIGAVGVSGDTGDMDEACALIGMAAAGLGRSA